MRMQATGQENEIDIFICQYQNLLVLMLFLESHVIMLELILLQSIPNQFYNSLTIVVSQTFFKMRGHMSSLINLQKICLLKLKEGHARHIHIIPLSIVLLIYYQISRIMERSL